MGMSRVAFSKSKSRKVKDLRSGWPWGSVFGGSEPEVETAEWTSTFGASINSMPWTAGVEKGFECNGWADNLPHFDGVIKCEYLLPMMVYFQPGKPANNRYLQPERPNSTSPFEDPPSAHSQHARDRDDHTRIACEHIRAGLGQYRRCDGGHRRFLGALLLQAAA